MKHLVLVDGHHMMYRAFYAIPPTLKMKNGEQVNAVYGVASMLVSMLKAEEPDSLMFCFDAGEETFRHQENATYKEGRAETPDEFYAQIPRILQLLDSFPIRRGENPKYEADDLLCAYAKAGTDAGMRVTIVTGDRDAFQLASDTVRIAIPHKGYMAPEYLDAKGVLAKYGVRPDQIPSYKGLVGDSSDNLPGVHGIGPKGAAKLLQEYDTLAGIYDHIEEIKGTTKQKLEKDKEQAFFCERMATLVCDFDLPVPLSDLKLEKLDLSNAIEAFRELEFMSLMKRLEGVSKSPYGSSHFAWPTVSVMSKKAPPTESQLALF
jgi:DNA polymerase-1